MSQTGTARVVIMPTGPGGAGCDASITDTMERPDSAATTGVWTSTAELSWRRLTSGLEANTQPFGSAFIESNLAKFVTICNTAGIQYANRIALAIEEMNLPIGVVRRALTGTIKFKTDMDVTDVSGSQTLFPICVGMLARGGTVRVRQAGPSATNPGLTLEFRLNTGTTERFSIPVPVVKNTWYVLGFYIEEGQHMKGEVWLDGDPRPGAWIESTITPNEAVNTPTLTFFEAVWFGHQHSVVGSTMTGYYDDLDIEGADRMSEYLFDRLNRAQSSGWGTSDFGLPYSNQSVVPSSPSVNTSTGGILSASNADKVQIDVVAAAVADTPWMQPDGWIFRMRWRASSLPGISNNYVEQETRYEQPGGAFLSLRMRVGNGSGTAGELQLDGTGFPTTAIAKTNWASVDYGVTWEYRPGVVNRVRVFPMSAAEPSTWDIELTPTGATADPTLLSRLYLRAARTVALGSGLTIAHRFIDWTYTGKPCYLLSGVSAGCPVSTFNTGLGGAGSSTGLQPTIPIPADPPFSAITAGDGDYLLLIVQPYGSSAVITVGPPAPWVPHPNNPVALGTAKTYMWWLTGGTSAAGWRISMSPSSKYSYAIFTFNDVEQIRTGQASGAGPNIAMGNMPGIPDRHISVHSQGMIQSNATPVAGAGVDQLTLGSLDAAAPLQGLLGRLVHDTPYEDAVGHQVVGTIAGSPAYANLTVAFYQFRDCADALITDDGGGGGGGGGGGEDTVVVRATGAWRAT